MRCPVCRAGELAPFFERAAAPVLCNVLWPDRESARRAPVGEIRLGFCAGCGMIHNAAFDPAALDYTQAYENSLHFSPRFQAFAEELAARLVRTYGLRGSTVVEIGCGKGDFLRLLCDLGRNRGLGFDASFEGDAGGDGSFRVVRERYSADPAHPAPDLICCRHVLEHIAEPREFLAEVAAAARRNPRVALYFEVPNVRFTLRDLGIWDVIYEHCSYFSAEALGRLFEESGFAVRDVRAAYGEQFLGLEAGLGGGAKGAGRNAGIDDLGRHVERFAAAFRDKVDAWSERLGRMLGAGGRVAIWGAGSKGVSFLATVRGADAIVCAVDVNPRKQGRFVPVSGQPVVAPEGLVALGVDEVLVMNPLYEGEVRAMLDRVGSRASVSVV